jgi:hypothetical protein
MGMWRHVPVQHTDPQFLQLIERASTDMGPKSVIDRR